MTKTEKLYAGIGRLGRLYHVGLHLTGYAQSVDYFVRILREEAGEDVQSILDAGCGTGPYTLAALRQFPRASVTAFDYQESLVASARRHIEEAGLEKRAQVFVGNVTSELSEIDGKKFDVIIVSGVLEYVPMNETVQNLSRFLRPGGHFFHSPVCDSLYGEVIGKFYHFTPRSQRETIEAFTSQGYVLKRIVKLPAWVPASFKEAHIFQKI